MRFYNRQHTYDCGIDLHVKTMYVLDGAGQVLVHRNMPSTPAAFLEVVAPYRDGLVVAAECMFTWYWLADVCAAEGIPFVLGHALAMKAIHGGKAKNDKIDSHKVAVLVAADCRDLFGRLRHAVRDEPQRYRRATGACLPVTDGVLVGHLTRPIRNVSATAAKLETELMLPKPCRPRRRHAISAERGSPIV
jgi:hypothetical protein